MKKRITKNTCMLVGSTPTFPHGVTDPMAEICKVGLSAIVSKWSKNSNNPKEFALNSMLNFLVRKHVKD